MSVQTEIRTTPAPEHRPSDEDLRRIVYGPDGEPDEIFYPHPRGTHSSTRKQREQAAAQWETEAAYPNDAAKNLERTEQMLALRLGWAAIAPNEKSIAKKDDEALKNSEPYFGVPYAKDTTIPRQRGYDQPTEVISMPEPAATTSTTEQEYTPRHRGHGMRIPLRRLITHGFHTPKHARQPRHRAQ